ncbi:cryptochrome/photolyase family protein [Leptospira kanakyensis]|uniref:cryptochrome/photolyase family protein n=1 Tax=Leptospira kanakyensis TaxID=2484968 RepID=UPI00223D4241|nr:cryptochrome/photolyase family protein [Leptospira kanakyensis]MCW7468149.1 cryptochrome/photolyase family protein [Leptospira kanakyensis]MCW7482317.1 cryptochrome/photolyase family protein [Leptospira kanakyensis]
MITRTQKMKKGLLILGNQLFDLSDLVPTTVRNQYTIFMREDKELCNYYQFHKQKIAFFFLAMRKYCDELKSLGFNVQYEFLNDSNISYDESLTNFLIKNQFDEFHIFEIEDKFFEVRIKHVLTQTKIHWFEHKSPMFLTSREEFNKYLVNSRKPFMKTFYQSQRKKFNILVDENGKPDGGMWSFDFENRKKLPKGFFPPPIPEITINSDEQKVLDLIENKFSTHPGDTRHLWLPTTRVEAKEWLNHFLKFRLYDFGVYEDALSTKFPFIHHSILTPFLNLGLLTPKEVIDETLKHAKNNDIPIQSLEGFIRQIIGWREFVRGIYQNFGETQLTSNFFGHKRKLTKHWYEGNTLIPPLDHVIHKCNRYGYAHHIERLMIVGSLMVLLEIDPLDSYKWFMEMFIDSSDWVMTPNVFGMALFSDGGIFATKPYICGSNYYKKMGSYPKGEWEMVVDGLYWKFIEKHKSFFEKNPRLSVMIGNLNRLDPKKKNLLYQMSDEWKERITHIESI